jgi:hypothetical protein
MTSALTTVDPTKRSIARFKIAGDPWPVIAAWAQLHRFKPREPQTDDVRLFQRGNALLTAPMRAQFTRVGEQMEVEAWIHIPLVSRIFALFLLPAEMNVASGGFRAVVPRSIARKAINDLLGRCSADLIA